MSLRSSIRPSKVRFDMNMPAELREYVRQAAESARAADGTKKPDADVVIEAITLDRDLGRLLGSEREALEAWASAHGLNLADDLAEVLAHLVKIGLKTSADYEATPEGAAAERRRGERRSTDRRT